MLENRSGAGSSFLFVLLLLGQWWSVSAIAKTVLDELSALDQLDDIAQRTPRTTEQNLQSGSGDSRICIRKKPYHKLVTESFKEARVVRHKVPCEADSDSKENTVETECYNERRIYVPTQRKVKRLGFRLVHVCCRGWTGVGCKERLKNVPTEVMFKRQLEQEDEVADIKNYVKDKRDAHPGKCPSVKVLIPNNNNCRGACQRDGECRPGMKCCIGLLGCGECMMALVETKTPAPTCRTKCLNGGWCENGRCKCPASYTGDSCEQALPKPCIPSCQKGKCVNGQCLCFSGYGGVACNKAICDKQCQNGGKCTAPNVCSCAPGWKGTTCTKPICAKDCQNGGQCVKPDTCVCSTGYAGPQCEQAVCLSKCLNGGKCQNGKCSCAIFWTGKSCETAICLRPCLNGGTCTAPNVCTCKSGWRGVQCEAFTCSQTCLNGGKCVASNTCQCLPGWTGNQCETAICSNGCGNGGKCIGPENCVCAPGYTGKACEFSLVTTKFPHSTVMTTIASNKGSSETSENMCVISGHGYYTTFDGKRFYFPGKCTYQLAGDCQDNTFSIHVVHNKTCTPSSATPCTRSLNLYLGGADIKVHLAFKNHVSVNGIHVPVPYVYKGLVIEKISSYIFISGWSGLSIKWDGKSSVYLKLPAEYRNKTCGLCGNFNGLPADDFKLKNGDQTDSIIRFGNNWKMTGLGETCSNTYDIDTRSFYSTLQTGDKLAIDNVCYRLYRLPFMECNRDVNPQLYFNQCREDMAKCNDTKRSHCACESFIEYSRACARKNNVLLWRGKDFCYPGCKPGFVHTECGSVCPKTCKNLNRRAICNAECIDGCFCPAGLAHDKGKCVKEEDCTCIHDKKTYQSGEKIKKDCNYCYCTKGRWKCTTFECPATCSVYGDPHFITFDGAQYDFMGVCRYIMAKDCATNLFTISLETMGCGSVDSASCSKSINVFLNNTSIKLSQNYKVTIQGRVVTLPFIGPGLLIRKVSSLMIKMETAIGLQISYDGNARVYVTAQPSLKNKTCGLCGNFNGNQRDDYMTPEGTIESNAAAFGNSWKLDPSCKNVKPARHPCEIQIQRASAAEKKCNKLKMAPFSACHHIIDPTEYIESCRYDVCACNYGVRCLCDAVAAYTKACASQGVIIEWRNSNILPECHVTCPPGEKYQECGSSCIKSCRDLAAQNSCKDECVAGCSCPNGTTANDFGSCVPLQECPCYEDGNQYPPGYIVYRANCLKCKCSMGKFTCSNDTDCKSSKCPAGQVWATHGAECASTCETLHLPCLSTQQAAACKCPNGLTWDDSIKKCIKPSDCPCHHHGRSYKSGESFQWDCNRCTCKGTKWECTTRQCPGTCSICGDPHYTTFDGKMYKFAGTCQYILAQDYCNGNVGTFRVQAENIPCGTTGVTCTKSVLITLKDTQIHMQRGKQWVATTASGYSRMTAKFEVVKSGFFHILVTEIGLTVMWDGGTRVYIMLQPNFKGRTCGMCGNFNDNQNDDFTTPEQDVVALARTFGDSWKVQSSCPDAKELFHPCSIHKSRAPWAHKQCNVINRELFKPCHREVNPKPYFDACYYDTCGCDLGGDCECLCTAIAAYATECNRRGVHIKWRSQELCPIQCTCEKNYHACGPAYPRTCKTLCKKPVLPIKCVEGCHCKNGTVELNGKCVRPAQCPCYDNGVEHSPGSLVIKNCQRCTCVDGCLQCSGPTCPPVTVAPITSTTKVATTIQSRGSTTGMSTSSPQHGSTTSASTLTSKPGSTTVASTLTSKPGSTTVASTLTPQPGSTTGASTLTPQPGSTTGASTLSPQPGSTTGASTLTPKPGSTTGASTSSPKPGSTTGATTLSPQPGSTTGASTSSPQPGSTTGATTLSPQPGSTTGASTLTPQPGSTTGASTLTPKPESTTGASTSTPQPGSTTGASTLSPQPGSTTGASTLSPQPGSTTGASTSSAQSVYSTGSSTPTTKPVTTVAEVTTKSLSTVSTIGNTSTIVPVTNGTLPPCREFLCSSGRCLELIRVCDGEPDCPDGADERGCPTSTKPWTNQTLPSTTAAPQQSSTPIVATTNFTNAWNKSIENRTATIFTSTATTPHGHYTTPRGNYSTQSTSTIVSKTFPPTCSPKDFLCRSNNKCIQNSKVCDHNDDCGDKSDEENCPTSCPPCSSVNFRCYKVCTCIPLQWVCDGNADCSDKSDELRCSTTSPLTTKISTKAASTTATTLNQTTNQHTTVHPVTNETEASTTMSTSYGTRSPPVTIGSTTSNTTGTKITEEVSTTSVVTTKQKLTSELPTKTNATTKETSPTTSTQTTKVTVVNQTTSFTQKSSTSTNVSIVTTKATTTQEQTTVTPTTITLTTTIAPCTGNKVFKPCVQSCQSSCQYLNQTCAQSTTKECTPGCQCPDNLVNNGTHCVLPGNCPCVDKSGRFRHPSESWEESCQNCFCFNNTVTCARKVCPTITFCPNHGYHVIVPEGECCAKCLPIETTTATTPPVCRGMRCRDGKCISRKWICDGERDCSDGEDERNCTFVPHCADPLGMENGKIADHQLSASSTASLYRGPQYARLNQAAVTNSTFGAWCPDRRYPNMRLWIDLNQRMKITKIATQGRPGVPHFVTKFKLQYSINGINWIPYSVDGVIKVFDGNKDNAQIKENKFETPFIARYLEFQVVAFNKNPCLRMELYGCNLEIPTTPAVTTTSTTVCPEFNCDNGTKCITNRWVCDGSSDCKDGSDEKDCGTCKPNHFRCKNGQCINKNFVCDGDSDCRDRSDELNCTKTTCSPSEYQCPNGACIRKQFLCDGDKDCASGVDEVGCPTTKPTATPYVCKGFICYSNKKCLAKSMECDGYKDCPLGEDELCCSNDTYTCAKSGKCIPRKYLCDVYIDCPHGEDENNCGTSTPRVTTPITNTSVSTQVTKETRPTTPPATTKVVTKVYTESTPTGGNQKHTQVPTTMKNGTTQMPGTTATTSASVTNGTTPPATTKVVTKVYSESTPTSGNQTHTQVPTTVKNGTTQMPATTATTSASVTNGTAPPATTKVVTKVYSESTPTSGNQTHTQVPTTMKNGTTQTPATSVTTSASVTNGTTPPVTTQIVTSATTSYCKEFLCPEGICISKSLVCDGEPDCPGGADEKGCQNVTTTTATTTKGSNQTSPATTVSTPTACIMRNYKICYRSCDSMAKNQSFCEQTAVAMLCGCPPGFMDGKDGVCYQNTSCPCVINGKVYKTGASVTEKCKKCVCFNDGFKCEAYCHIENCPQGQELVQEAGKCCECRPKIVCPPQMIETACACQQTCEVPINTNCTLETCKRGCACSETKYYNGTHCVEKSECYCIFNGTRREPNSEWRSGECRLCKCVNGRTKCGKICDISRCPPSMELVMPNNGCCFCRSKATTPAASTSAQNVTTSFPTTKSQTTTSQTATSKGLTPNTYGNISTAASSPGPNINTTTMPIITNATSTTRLFTKQTSPVNTTTIPPTTKVTTKQIKTSTTITSTVTPSSCKHSSKDVVYEKNGCISRIAIPLSSCSGTCASGASISLDQSFIKVNCHCCSPKGVQFAYVPLDCKNGTVINFRYVKFNSCSCDPCKPYV